MVQLPVFDRGEALRRLLRSEKLLREMIAIFLRDLPRLNSLLERALEAKSIDALKLASHSLKGSASQVGGRAVAESAWHIEKAADSGNLPLAMELAASLKDELNDLVKILENELAKAPA